MDCIRSAYAATRAQRPVCDYRGVGAVSLARAPSRTAKGAVAADVDEWWSVAWAKVALRTAARGRVRPSHPFLMRSDLTIALFFLLGVHGFFFSTLPLNAGLG